jgi:agmatine/peptidylarginine deiminase
MCRWTRRSGAAQALSCLHEDHGSRFPHALRRLFLTREEAPPYQLPPEWEPHEAVWFTYQGNAVDTVLDQVVRRMDADTRVVCAADNDSLARTIAARWDGMGITNYRLEVLSDSLEGLCVRDAGPIFLRQRDGSLAVLDADWNYYGDHENVVGYSTAQLAFEDSFPTMLAAHGPAGGA